MQRLFLIAAFFPCKQSKTCSSEAKKKWKEVQVTKKNPEDTNRKQKKNEKFKEKSLQIPTLHMPRIIQKKAQRSRGQMQTLPTLGTFSAKKMHIRLHCVVFAGWLSQRGECNQKHKSELQPKRKKETLLPPFHTKLVVMNNQRGQRRGKLLQVHTP